MKSLIKQQCTLIPSILLIILVSGCGFGGTGSTPEQTYSAIEVTPDPIVLSVESPQQFHVTLWKSTPTTQESSDVTNLASWNVTNNWIYSISSTGVVTCHVGKTPEGLYYGVRLVATYQGESATPNTTLCGD